MNLSLNFRWVIDILSRLVETVAEHNDDMQGYVTEILLTLTHNIDGIHEQINGSLSVPAPQIVAASKEPTNGHVLLPSTLTNKIEALQNRMFPFDRRQPSRTFRHQPRDQLHIVVTNSGMATAPTSPRNHSNMPSSTLVEGQSTTTICPSISSHTGFLLRPEDQQATAARFSPDSNRSCASTTSTLTRSHSAQNVRQQQLFFPNPSANVTSNSPTSNDTEAMAASINDAKTVLAQLFCIGICLLESDYEYEFTLAVQLLTTVVNKVQLNTSDYRERIMSILKAMKWSSYPGLQALVLKGCTSTVTFESTMVFLGCLTDILTLPFVPMNNTSLSMNVVALLPYMMYNYDNQHVVSIHCAERLARVCQEHDDRAKLTNLATVMTLYAQGKFGSTASQWAKCVLKYLTDVYMSDTIAWIRLLCEILDNGPSYLQLSIIDIFHHLVNLIDTKSFTDYALFNSELVRTLCKYVNRPDFCTEVTKTLKLLIQRSSTLSTPKHIPNSNHYNNAPLISHMGKVEFHESHKSSIELPGRSKVWIEFERRLSKSRKTNERVFMSVRETRI